MPAVRVEVRSREDATTVDAEMGLPDDAPRVMTFAMEEMDDEPLTAVPYFPIVLFLFCLFRLLKPLLLRWRFAGADLWEDGGAVFADTCELAGVIGGFVSAILLSAPFRYLLFHLPTPAKVLQLHEPLALGLLAASVLMDLLHNIVALVRFQYFWTPSMADGVADSGAEMFAFVLIGLHLVGLLGTTWLVVRFIGRFLSAMSQASRRSLADVKKAKAEKRYLAEDPVSAYSPGSRSPAAGSNKVPVDFGGAMGASAAASELRMGGTNGSAREPPDESEPLEPVWMPDSQVEPPAAPLAAWFWADDGWTSRWLEVAVIRTLGDDMANVRMGGGIVVPVKRSLLRPRFPGEPPPEESPGGRPRKPKQAWASNTSNSKASTAAGSERGESPPRPASGERPSRPRTPTGPPGDGSDADSPPREHTKRHSRRRRSGMDGADSAGASSSAAGASQPPPSFAAEPQPPAAAPEPEDDSEGARWAASRMEQLRKELIELDSCTLEERKKKLRNLQRELHPDKQQEDFRSYAQPLFLLVQREWELLAASQASNADQ